MKKLDTAICERQRELVLCDRVLAVADNAADEFLQQADDLMWQKKMRQMDLCRASNLHPSRLSTLLSGKAKRRGMTIETAARIAVGLNMRLRVVLEEWEKPAQSPYAQKPAQSRMGGTE